LLKGQGSWEEVVSLAVAEDNPLQVAEPVMTLSGVFLSCQSFSDAPGSGWQEAAFKEQEAQFIRFQTDTLPYTWPSGFFKLSVYCPYYLGSSTSSPHAVTREVFSVSLLSFGGLVPF
jgi:hypothetical protein